MVRSRLNQSGKRMIWKGAFRSDPQNFRPETSQMAYSRLLPRGIASDGSFFKTAPSHSRLPMAAECGVYGVGWLPEVAAVTATVSRSESCRPSALWLVTHRGAKAVSRESESLLIDFHTPPRHACGLAAPSDNPDCILFHQRRRPDPPN